MIINTAKVTCKRLAFDRAIRSSQFRKLGLFFDPTSVAIVPYGDDDVFARVKIATEFLESAEQEKGSQVVDGLHRISSPLDAHVSSNGMGKARSADTYVIDSGYLLKLNLS